MAFAPRLRLFMPASRPVPLKLTASSFTTRSVARSWARSIAWLPPFASRIFTPSISSRHIDLKDLKIEGLEVWVNFDDQGRSNFRNLHLPPPEPNKRILFAYSTAHIEIKNSLIHYGDVQHSLSGEARNLHAVIDPDNPNAPVESAMNRVALGLSKLNFCLRRPSGQQHRY